MVVARPLSKSSPTASNHLSGSTFALTSAYSSSHSISFLSAPSASVESKNLHRTAHSTKAKTTVQLARLKVKLEGKLDYAVVAMLAPDPAKVLDSLRSERESFGRVANVVGRPSNTIRNS